MRSNSSRFDLTLLLRICSFPRPGALTLATYCLPRCGTKARRDWNGGVKFVLCDFLIPVQHCLHQTAARELESV
ncbi:hypothetical protein E2C01_075037 [Portunus trituberculatus]|uniref:Uncharacterized protein n=1 Tax=Portunus trituberculatus TaxID=210409 RepID=A0A5B7IFU9_PORTR|nr:hypothetical protein [Portunus trituberculatus]